MCTIIGDLGANISDMEFLDRKPDFFKLILTVDLRDVEHLHAVLSRLARRERPGPFVLGLRPRAPRASSASRRLKEKAVKY